jgi:hypothetical protein
MQSEPGSSPRCTPTFWFSGMRPLDKLSNEGTTPHPPRVHPARSNTAISGSLTSELVRATSSPLRPRRLAVGGS